MSKEEDKGSCYAAHLIDVCTSNKYMHIIMKLMKYLLDVLFALGMAAPGQPYPTAQHTTPRWK